MFFANPQTIKTKPGIHRAGAVIAMPQITNGIPVKNKGFLNALSISRHLQEFFSLKHKCLPESGGPPSAAQRGKDTPCTQ
ncbi:hypothetical protein [Pseudomonas sp. B22129]|uniref:hypothetical protein n=1 Tax=Pseudomonas sp. B22129 TaxID=3235111 RepID=UPI003783981E